MRLDDVLEYAIRKHEGQKDKGGKPYIWHPVFLALQMQTEEEKIVALLHDVFEDTDSNFRELDRFNLSDKAERAIRLLTHDKDEPYMDYIEKISTNEIARKVKIADIYHNMDFSRLPPSYDSKAIERLSKKYIEALSYLLNKEDKNG